MTDPVSWWEVELEIPVPIADDVCGMLIFHGAQGAGLESHEFPPPPKNDGNPRNAPSEGHAKVLASLTVDLSQETVLQIVATALNDLGRTVEESGLQIRKRNDTHWAEAWKSFFTPLLFGEELWVLPRWDTAEANDEMLAKLKLGPDAKLIYLEPGLAFGTGQHATTSLCLKILTALKKELPHSMLDVGCGSGILSIAAAKLGVRRVLAVDNDPLAVRITKENARDNGVESFLDVTQTPLIENKRHFPLVVANIIAPILIVLAPAILRALEPGGTLILSGMLKEQVQPVKQAYEAVSSDLVWTAEKSEGEWFALVGTRLESRVNLN